MNDSVEAHALLQHLIDRFGATIASRHRWFDERERWLELVHAIISRSTTSSEHVVRDLCTKAFQDGYLQTPSDIALIANQEALYALLLEGGLSEAEIENSSRAILQIAAVLIAKYDGRLHLYLRAAFRKMLSQMVTEFSITSLDASTQHQALTFFLQNTCQAPISLHAHRAEQICDAAGTSHSALLSAADDCYIHTPLLDDLLYAATDLRLHEDE